MKNKYARNKNMETKRKMNSDGLAYRELRTDDHIGQIARLRIGEGATAQIITLEQQPGHEPIAFVQGVKSRTRFFNEDHYRPTGNPEFLSIEEARARILSAYNDQIKPVDEDYLAVAMNFLPSATTPKE